MTTEKNLYLVQSNIRTVRNPGDDDMTEPTYEKVSRLVRASTEEIAKQTFELKFERYTPYYISVSCEDVEVSEIIESPESLE